MATEALITSEFLEIEGGVVRIIEKKIIAEKRLEDVLPGLEFRPPLMSPLLPRSCILFYWDETDPKKKMLIMLCEAMPGIKNIVKEGYRYKMAMPWAYFVFIATTAGDPNGKSWSVEKYKAFHARDRVTNLDSKMAVAFLPNVDENARICYGATATKENQPLADRIDTLVNEWYVTLFTDHLIEGRRHPRPFGATNWKPWVDATVEHGPTAYLKFPEWNDPLCLRWTVRTAMGLKDIPVEMKEMTAIGEIPEIPQPMTFGRAEEWAKNLAPEQRQRLLGALTNMKADNPKLFKAAEEKDVAAPAVKGTGGKHAGGEQIDTGQRVYT